MKKRELRIWIIITTCLVIFIIYLAFYLVQRSTIIGQAYIDNGTTFDVLDPTDKPADGLKIQLWKVTGGAENELIAETITDENGYYQFLVIPGTYRVSPILTCKGYPGWDRAGWLRRTGDLSASLKIPKEILQGPIFLIR